jgi:hypothetical protein
MMAWLEAHQTLQGHPKTRKAARVLGIGRPQLIGHLFCLWWWALDYAQAGDLTNFSADELAIAAEWDGEPAEFLAALIECRYGDSAGFLEQTADGRLLIHDWDTYAGKLIDRREANAVRMRAARAEHVRARPTNKESTSKPREPHVQGTWSTRVELQDLTEQDQTQPEGVGGEGKGAGKGEGPPEPVAALPEALPAMASEAPPVSKDALDEMHAILSRFQDRGYVVDQRFYLKVSELYPRLDLALEAMKLSDWLREPKNKGRRCGSRFVLNWLAKAEEDRIRRLAERDQAKTVNLNGAAKPYVPKPPPELPRFTPDQEKASDAARERVRQQLKAQGVLHKFDAIGGPSP